MSKLLKKFGLPLFFAFFALTIGFPAHADWINGMDLARTFSGLPSTNQVEDVVLNIMLWLLRLFTLIAVIGFVVNGLMYIMAGASSGLAEKAKKGVGFAIAGVAIGLAGYIIISQIDTLLQ